MNSASPRSAAVARAVVTLVPLAEISPSMIPTLAAHHRDAIPTLLADLGSSVVERYYRIAQKDPSTIGICALVRPESDLVARVPHYPVAASAVGSPDPSTLTARLRRPLHLFAGQMLRLAATHPWVLVQLARSLRSASPPLAPGQIEMVYMGVAREVGVRRFFVGKAILDEFLEVARAARYTSVACSVYTHDRGTFELCARTGFTVSKTFTEGPYHRHRLEREL